MEILNLPEPDLKEPCPCRGTKMVYKDGELVPCTNPECLPVDLAPQAEKLLTGDLNLVPKLYRSGLFQPDQLYRSELIPETSKVDGKFVRYVKTLDKMVASIGAGMVPSRSYFIAAPPGFGKNNAVYASMVGGMFKGLKVAPYYDAAQARELYEKGKLDDDYYNSDILFIKMTAGNVTVSDLQMCKLITERRARLSKGTIVTSRMPVNYFKSMEPSIVELIREETMEFDYFRWCYIAAPFTMYNGKR